MFAFRSVCESGGEDVLSRMGQLMKDSHASCRDQYECSHELLDVICRTAEGVAYGARLTGAGSVEMRDRRPRSDRYRAAGMSLLCLMTFVCLSC